MVHHAEFLVQLLVYFAQLCLAVGLHLSQFMVCFFSVNLAKFSIFSEK
jgi:hypothetical protein